MRIIHVVGHLESATSGLGSAVPRLCRALVEVGLDSTIYTAGGYPASWDALCGVRDHPVLPLAGFLPILSRLSISPSMAKALLEEAESADVFHAHSLWSVPGRYAYRAARRLHPFSLVVSPHGTLSEWSMGYRRRRKALVSSLWQKKVLESAACLHATSGAELGDIRAQGLRTPVAVIPNGVDIPETLFARRREGRRRLVFLGRIHPTKRVNALLRAWAKVQEQFDEWELVIAGPTGSAYAQEMTRLVTELAAQRVLFVGEVDAGRKRSLLLSAEILVLPSHSENFGMVVAEALSFGVPVIASKGTPWPGLVSRGCGWWIEGDTTTLAQGLEDALGRSQGELAAMGSAGREWMQRDFSWHGVARDFRSVYRWLTQGGEMPDCVQVARG